MSYQDIQRDEEGRTIIAAKENRTTLNLSVGKLVEFGWVNLEMTPEELIDAYVDLIDRNRRHA